jgi:hypothetical protein
LRQLPFEISRSAPLLFFAHARMTFGDCGVAATAGPLAARTSARVAATLATTGAGGTGGASHLLHGVGPVRLVPSRGGRHGRVLDAFAIIHS